MQVWTLIDIGIDYAVKRYSQKAISQQNTPQKL